MYARFDNLTGVLQVFGMTELELADLLQGVLPRGLKDLRSGIREYQAAFLIPTTHQEMAGGLRDYVADHIDLDKIGGGENLSPREIRWTPKASIQGVRIHMRRVEHPTRFVPEVLDLGICHTTHSPVI